jgi:competence protein
VTLLFIGTIINAEQHKLSPKIIIYNLYKCPNIHFISNNHRSQIWISDSAKNSKNLTFIKKTFWKEYQLNPYIITAKSNTNENYSYFNFSGKTIIVLQENMSYKTNGEINVDLLYICKGYKQHLDNALKHITPKLIIIDNSLSDFYRNRLIKEAHKKVIKVHDIKRQGACILDLERQK